MRSFGKAQTLPKTAYNEDCEVCHSCACLALVCQSHRFTFFFQFFKNIANNTVKRELNLQSLNLSAWTIYVTDFSCNGI